ncbi:5901_t:CDS:1, partial [Racocetra fulgida]
MEQVLDTEQVSDTKQASNIEQASDTEQVFNTEQVSVKRSHTRKDLDQNLFKIYLWLKQE